MGDDASEKTDDELFPYDMLWINDEHTVALNYMCSEMMFGLFSFQWWNVMSKEQNPNQIHTYNAKKALYNANVGYDAMPSHVTEQGSTCEYDWTLAWKATHNIWNLMT